MHDGKLAKTQHDQIDHESADQVSQHGTEGADIRDDVPRSEKKSAAQHTTQTQHDQVTQLHGTLEPGFFILCIVSGTHDAFQPKGFSGSVR